MIEDDVVGRVLGLADLLQHHGALARQLLGIEGRVLQDVADDIDGERQVGREDLGVIGRLLAGGIVRLRCPPTASISSAMALADGARCP